MAPQQIQSLEILMAAIPELEQKISEELVENPTLELLDSGTEELIGNPVEGGSDALSEGNDGDLGGTSETLETLLKLDELWHDRMPASAPARPAATTDDEERRQFFFDSLVAEESLQDNLMDQLRERVDLDEETRRLCEEIIGSIDDSGYLRTHLADIATACHTMDMGHVEKALRIVQEFDPPGIGARDLRECLLLQIERQRHGRKSLAYRVVDKHLDEIGRNKLVAITKAMNISMNTLKEVLSEIRTLHPYPGALVRPDNPGDFVAPEVFVEKGVDGEWTVRTNKDYVPRLRISPYYLKLLKDKGTSAETKQYIRAKVSNSKMLLRALEQRESTIVRITRSLLKFQKGFFEHGIDHMRPLTMNQVAEEIGVHETTVSRAIANKYVMTPHGLFPFKLFFSTGYESSSGELVSNLAVKEKLREFIANEPGKRPLSDQKLAELLKAEGFQVARRTVAKYREEMGLLPSNMRRRY
ncbi:MAG: RNA polymerase factor sigma-54 [Candidatus Pacebacteria bacterium]|nr:RNA polymerase factor sigma-54 [Candidatus Paceibacterota bacterium]